MIPLKSSALSRCRFALTTFLLLLASLDVPIIAQTTVYWDVNGTVDGAGSASPGGSGFEWNSSNAFWNTDPAGGAGALSAWDSGDIAVFSAGSDATGTFAIDVIGTHGIGGLTFQEGAVSLNGGVLNLTAPATIDVAESLTATLAGTSLTGGFGLTKNGKGTLTLSGATTGTFTGGFRLASGTVELATTAGNALGAGAILIESSAGNSSNINPVTLRLLADNQISDAAHITVVSRQYRAALFDLNGFNETIGGLTIAGLTGTPDVGVRTGAGGILTVAGDIFLHNDRGGSTGNNVRDVLITGTGSRSVAAPDSGILDLAGGIRTITVESRAATIYPNSDATIETTIQNGGIIKEGEQMLILTGTNTYTGGTTINAGTLRIGAGSTTGSISGDVVNNAALEFHRSTAYTFSGDISGTGSLTKMGNNVLTLTGNNTYSGLTQILTGTLQVEKLGMAGIASGSNVGTNPVIELGSGAANIDLVYIGDGETTDKILRFTTTGTPTITASGTGGVRFASAFEFAEAGDRTLTLSGTSTAANALLAELGDPAPGGVLSLLKTGAGTWVFEGTNTYTGTTTISDGTLRLSGNGDLGEGGLLIQNGTFEIAGSADVTLNTAAGFKISASELIDYAVIMGGGPSGSSATINIAADRTLHLNGHLGFSSTNNNLAATISGGELDLGDTFRLIVVGNSTAADPDLTISSHVTSGPNATFMKSGAGTLQLTQELDVATVQVNSGTLELGGLENTITGSLQVGYNGTASLSYDTPGGHLAVGSGSTDSLDVGIIFNAQAYSYATPRGTLDLRGSGSLTANVGTVRVGVHTSASGNTFSFPDAPSLDGLATPASMSPNLNALHLPTNSTITAATSFTVGDAASASVGTGVDAHQVQFGEGLNVIKTPLMYIGHRKGSGTGTIRAGGTLQLEGVAAGARTALYVGYNAVNTAGATQSRLDLSDGTFVASLSSLIIGWKSSGSSTTAGSSIGAVTLGSSSANDVNVSGNVVIGYIGGNQGSATTFGRGTLNVGGGSFVVGGDVELAKMAPTTNAITNPNFTSTGTLTLTGGTFTVNGNVTRTEDALDRNVATVTLDGATLNMTGGNIGSSASPVVFNARSGTLRNLSALNGNAPLVKSTEGTLRIGGQNTYGGGTQIQAGVLEVLVSSSTGLGDTSINGTTAVLAGNGTASGITTLTAGSIRPGANAGADNGQLTFAGDLTLNATQGLMLLGITSPTGVADLSTYTIEQIPDVYNFATYNYETDNRGDHDHLLIEGIFTWNAGTKLTVEDEDLQLGYGHVYNLLDWAGLMEGGPTFASDTTVGGNVNSYLDLPDLSGTGYQWDISLFTSHGVIVMVPEPGRATLLLLSAAFAIFRRRRPVGS